MLTDGAVEYPAAGSREDALEAYTVAGRQTKRLASLAGDTFGDGHGADPTRLWKTSGETFVVREPWQQYLHENNQLGHNDEGACSMAKG